MCFITFANASIYFCLFTSFICITFLTICVASWENRADVAGLAFELGRLKVKKKYDNFFVKEF